MSESETSPVRAHSTIRKQIRTALAREAEARGEELPKKISKRWKEGKRQSSVPLFQAQAEWQSWLKQRGWEAFDYQKEAWQAYEEGHSGLIVLPTGSGKTLAALGGPLMALRAEGTPELPSEIRVLYISPLKALVRDVEKSVQSALQELGWDFRVETRTGDTSASQKQRQNLRLPHVLFITPESLALLLTQVGWQSRLGGIRAIILDEWHELLGSKRGSLLELTLARLRGVASQARTWALSATISDPKGAAEVATCREDFKIIRHRNARPVEIETILPEKESDLAWFGFNGLHRVHEVAVRLNLQQTTMIFTNTRGQAERWYGALLALHPEWEGKVALHHGSLDREERERIEAAVKEGSIPVVVATSSLDLGIDFPLVEKVIQIGSVKGMSRATQRAGRAFHRPGEKTCLTVCPTHFLEYVEVAALRRALADGQLDQRLAIERPLDVLVQFVVSSALGEGFRAPELLREIRSAYSFRKVSDEEFEWVLAFATSGGHTLRAYPQFRKIAKDAEGFYRFATPQLARLHLMNIGTIVGDSSVRVRFLRGGTLGQMDEGFITKLKPGDVFRFGGKALELVHLKDLTAYVKIARGRETVATVWGGHALPISPSISRYMREILAEVALEKPNQPLEVEALRETFAIQGKKSAIPGPGEILVERLDTREGHHLFVYTWEGRAVNEGLGHLLAYRLSLGAPNTIAVSANDHGFECLAVNPFPGDEEIRQALRTHADLEQAVERSLNFTEMAKRAFREVARVSGLIQTGTPRDRKPMRHLQMSSSLLFDVFLNYEPAHPLLQEAFREVKRTQLELPRLRKLLKLMGESRIRIENPKGLTPFSFPLYLERIRSRISSETLADRVARLQKKVFAA